MNTKQNTRNFNKRKKTDQLYYCFFPTEVKMFKIEFKFSKISSVRSKVLCLEDPSQQNG